MAVLDRQKRKVEEEDEKRAWTWRCEGSMYMRVHGLSLGCPVDFQKCEGSPPPSLPCCSSCQLTSHHRRADVQSQTHTPTQRELLISPPTAFCCDI